MTEPEIAYTITPTGRLIIDTTDKLEALLGEQRAAVATLLLDAFLYLDARRHDCFPAAVSLVQALTILGLLAGPPEE